MIDVSELMNDPDFASHYTVMRTTGKWNKGRFELNAPRELRFYGPVQPATVKEVEQLPTGNQVKGIMKFMCKRPKRLFVTREMPVDGSQTEELGAASDEIHYQGDVYEVIQVMPWSANGYMRAFAVLKGGVVWKQNN